MKPLIGQTWYRADGVRYRIIGTGTRLLVLNTDTGNREWVDCAEFQIQHKPVKPWLPLSMVPR